MACRKVPKRTCPVCGTTFRKKRQRFCSRTCYQVAVRAAGQARRQAALEAAVRERAAAVRAGWTEAEREKRGRPEWRAGGPVEARPVRVLAP